MYIYLRLLLTLEICVDHVSITRYRSVDCDRNWIIFERVKCPRDSLVALIVLRNRLSHFEIDLL